MKLRYVLFLVLGLMQGMSAVEAVVLSRDFGDIGPIEAGSWAEKLYTQMRGIEVISRAPISREVDLKAKAGGVVQATKGTLALFEHGTRPATDQELKLIAMLANQLGFLCDLAHTKNEAKEKSSKLEAAYGNSFAEEIAGVLSKQTPNYKYFEALMVKSSPGYAKVQGVRINMIKYSTLESEIHKRRANAAEVDRVLLRQEKNLQSWVAQCYKWIEVARERNKAKYGYFKSSPAQHGLQIKRGKGGHLTLGLREKGEVYEEREEGGGHPDARWVDVVEGMSTYLATNIGADFF